MTRQAVATRGLPVMPPEDAQRRLEHLVGPDRFDEVLQGHRLGVLERQELRTLQVNVGKLCNQKCRHCHVGAGPDRTEQMTRETMEACLTALEGLPSIQVVDLTGGAPELHRDFRWFVRELRARGRHVIDRCNLTVIETPNGRDLPAFFRDHDVEVVCSLPHYQKLSTDRQRGDGVYAKSIRALKRLNQEGYGDEGTGRTLTLVTYPVGAFLPSSQASLEREWKRELLRNHQIVFNDLIAITNMPISRYLDWLVESDNLESYMQTLLDRFNPATVAGVMCRSMLSVSWDGRLYDCDFNQMLELDHPGPMKTIEELARHPEMAAGIQTGPHCFGCTAGAGSSCGGAVT